LLPFMLCCACSQAIEQAAVLYDDYCRVITPENLLTDESEEVCTMLMECLELRRKWLFRPQVRPEQRKVSAGMLCKSLVGLYGQLESFLPT
jgi:hypothetical protein